MRLEIPAEKGVPIQPGMIGLFFEDINYAADGGLYAEMIENRSFEFYKAGGTYADYYTQYDGTYGWSCWPDNGQVEMAPVTGSPLSEENPHYLRLTAKQAGTGVTNKAYDGIVLRADTHYELTFWARRADFTGHFIAKVVKDGICYAEAEVQDPIETSYNRFGKYTVRLTAREAVEGAQFVLCLSEPGTVELDYVSLFPADAVAGLFRKDLFQRLLELKPGFIRFPGGCVVEGNTLANRYNYKDSLKEPWQRKNNWNRWAVHGNDGQQGPIGPYAHYNQTLGLGYYEYFLLCELVGAIPLPVVNVGLACQYQSKELVSIESEEFATFIQDALDLIEFATGDPDTKWGAVRAKMGHPAPFALTMLGIGNEQWETAEADFFRRYTLFEQAIHQKAPDIRLIGSAGPDITSDHYEDAWKFYRENKAKPGFVYAVDEHYYVKPEWLFAHTDFYDSYDREIKVFSGEYAAHPLNGMNRPDANTLEGALAEAAFLTGVERNADVVVLASYAPLFARVGYAQWSPDMIWFDATSSYVTPSYYVQQMYAQNLGNVTIATGGLEKQAAQMGVYYSLSYSEDEQALLVKLVNKNEKAVPIELAPAAGWQMEGEWNAVTLAGTQPNAINSIAGPENISPREIHGKGGDSITLPPFSFTVLRINANME